MPETLLQTKLYTPPLRPNLISRPRLIDQLNQGLHQGNKLTLVSAPAGFGKTTLVSAWAQQTNKPIAWLSLDASDNDLIRFLTYFIAALQTIKSHVGEGILAAFQSPEEINIEIILTALLNETTELSDDLILILDDYHIIDSRPIDQAITFLLDHLSSQMHLIMLTRADPRFPLPRMRARGELVEIRERDLRFSLDETTLFLRTILESDLSAENVQILQARTEGWIAGLQLAVLSLQGQDDPSGKIAAFGSGHHYIVEYLIEEVLNRQPESLQAFLMQTSILSRLNGSLCDAITCRADGDATLAWCEKANLFLSPLGGEHRWYRYHRLFADVMSSRLQRLYPDQVPGLHVRAAEWFKQHKLFDEAIKHALVANEYPFAAEIVESQAQDLVHLGNLATLMGWLDKLPPEIIRERPRLGIDSAWVYLLIGKSEEIEHHLVAAEKNLDHLENPDELRGQIAAIRAYSAARLGLLDQATGQAHAALDLLPENDSSIRSVVAFVLAGIYQLRDDLQRALTYLREASRLGKQAGNIHLAVAALSVTGDILKSQGHVAESEKVYHQALQLGSGPSGRPLPITAGVFYNLAELRLAQKDLVSARQLALTGLDLAEKWINAEGQVVCNLTLAQIEHLEGNQDEAWNALEKAKRLAATHQLPPGREKQIKACETALLAGPVRGADQGLLDPLSERELEVLGLFAAGLTNQEIADQLIISLGTVKAHSSNIYRKLDVRNRAQAVVRANELRLL